nr:pentatricopeptide repeat-containing protein [Tanacetum cinerariifolium]
MAPSGSDALYFDVHHDGLKIIERDYDVVAMYDFVDSYGKLDTFMSHIHQNLAEFYFQNFDMEESRDEATSRLRIHEIMVKDASNMTYNELVSWAKEKTQMQTPKKKVVTPKRKVVKHVVDDVDIPLMNLVESPKLKRKLLSRNSPRPIAKRKLMGKVTSPTSYIVNKGKSVLNEGNTVKKSVEKGRSTMVEDANKVKKAVDKCKGKMVEEEHPIRIPVRRNNGIVIEDNVNPSVENDTDSESDPAHGINYSLYSDSDSDSDSEYFDKSVDYLSEGEDELIELRKRKTEAKNAPKVGDWFVDIQQLKDCLTYYALANGFSLWFYRSSLTQPIAKCGLRPDKTKDPKLGKQSKFKRNAKRWALNEGETTIEDHYGYIRSYAKAILESNPGDDLGTPTGQGLTLMSYQHKGLIEAVKEVMPYAE